MGYEIQYRTRHTSNIIPPDRGKFWYSTDNEIVYNSIEQIIATSDIYQEFVNERHPNLIEVRIRSLETDEYLYVGRP